MEAAPTETFTRERSALRLSVFGAVGMGALGVGFAIPTGSQAVLLDGVFSSIGAVMGLLTLRVATLVRRTDDEHFHFGYAAYEPILNLTKGLLMIFIALFAGIFAGDAILRGGRPIAGGIAIVYALVAAAGCFAIGAIEHRSARSTGSPLLAVDSKNWLIDGLMSSGVALAFGLALLLRGTSFEWFYPYADPVVVLAMVCLSLPVPVRIVAANWRQLVGRAPGQDVMAEARRRLARGLDGIDGLTPHLRVLETGRSFYVQLYLVVDPDAPLAGVERLDEIRRRVIDALTEADDAVGVDVVFTRDPRWARLSTPGAARHEPGG